MLQREQISKNENDFQCCGDKTQAKFSSVFGFFGRDFESMFVGHEQMTYLQVFFMS